MGRFIDLTNKQLGFWLVKRRSFVKNREIFWECVCKCGQIRQVGSHSLRSGTSVSCGCYSAEQTGNRARTHGLSRTKEYRAWAHAKERCGNPKNKKYHIYGAKGIKMHPEWRNSFEKFYQFMGPCPDGLTLDRINSNGNYEPGNCRWATYSTQGKNTSQTKYIEFHGKRQCLSDWARECGAHPSILSSLIRYYTKKGFDAQWVIENKMLNRIADYEVVA